MRSTHKPVVLMVATAGGHLDELLLLSKRWDFSARRRVWSTGRTHHTSGVLNGEEVAWMPVVRSGEWIQALRLLPWVLRLHSRLKPDLLITTGAMAAVPHLLTAYLRRVETWYFESATRTTSPSRTGQLAQLLPNVRCFVQGPGWGDPRWSPIVDVFDEFESTPATETGDVSRVVVSMGGEKFPFHQAIDRAYEVLQGCDVLWQTGSTEVVRGGATLRQWVPGKELNEAYRNADVVIIHAGVGSVLTALQSGKIPIVLARRQGRGEHIDDHQTGLAAMLESRGLVIATEPDQLSWAHIQQAASRTVRQRQPERGSRSA